MLISFVFTEGDVTINYAALLLSLYETIIIRKRIFFQFISKEKGRNFKSPAFSPSSWCPFDGV